MIGVFAVLVVKEASNRDFVTKTMNFMEDIHAMAP